LERRAKRSPHPIDLRVAASCRRACVFVSKNRGRPRRRRRPCSHVDRLSRKRPNQRLSRRSRPRRRRRQPRPALVRHVRVTHLAPVQPRARRLR
jgi:hypothetical protein